MTIRNTLITILLLATFTAQANTPPKLEAYAHTGVQDWQALLNKNSKDALVVMSKRDKHISTAFTRLDDGDTSIESNHGVQVAYTDSGFMFVFSHDVASPSDKNGRYDIYLATDRPDNPTPDAPRHLILDLDDHGFTNKMVRNYLGAAHPLEEQLTRRTKAHVAQQHLMTRGSQGYLPLSIQHNSFLTDGKRLTSVHIPWSSLLHDLPIDRFNSAIWRVKFIRTAPDGTRYLWGTNDKPFAGYGRLHWPRITQKSLDNVYRQSLTIAYLKKYQSDSKDARYLWRVAREEAIYAFIDLGDIKTFQPRNLEMDNIFFKTAVEPLLKRNANIAKTITVPKRSNNFPILTMQQNLKEEALAALPRLLTFNQSIDEMRRDFMLNCLVGRIPELPPEEEKVVETAPETSWETLEGLGNKIEIDLDAELF